MENKQPRLLKKMNTLQVEAAINASAPLFLPVGTIEAHGRHLPVGTDTFCAEKIAESLSSALDGVVAPSFEYGLTKVLAQTSPASFFPEDLFEAFIEKVIDNFRSQGFKTIIVVNGHGGNRDPLKNVIRRLSRLRPTGLAVVNWWIISEHFVEKVYNCKPGGHAAVEETALMLRYFPELVESANYQAETDDYTPDEGIWLFPPPGEVLISDAGQGQPDFDPQKAEKFSELLIEDLQKRLKKWLNSFGRIKGGLRP
jgi:creatinine amidohydrolase